VCVHCTSSRAVRDTLRPLLCVFVYNYYYDGSERTTYYIVYMHDNYTSISMYIYIYIYILKGYLCICEKDNCPRRPALIIYGSYAYIRSQLVVLLYLYSLEGISYYYYYYYTSFQSVHPLLILYPSSSLSFVSFLFYTPRPRSYSYMHSVNLEFTRSPYGRK